jgi:hypothetical protein
MSTKKWGETFLKTGLPLEHLALTTLMGAGWQCEPKWEYQRENRDGKSAWFEVDLVANAPPSEAGSITILTECKYHDEQRFWVFLPCSGSALAQRGALSAGGDPESDSEVVHHGPYEPLTSPGEHTMIGLAPQSMWGVTVSRAGVREENSVQHALEQLSHAYAPFCLERAYDFCHREPEAILPAVVTSAKLFRLKAQAHAIDAIRRAGSAHDIADEVSWLWCYHPPSGALLDYNAERIESWRARPRYVERFAGLDDRLAALWSGPRWFIIVNAEHLAAVYSRVQSTYASLSKNYARSKTLWRLIAKGAKKARERRSRLPATG